MKTQMTFNETFRAAHNTKCRYVVLKGSAGSGKSVDTAMFMLLRMLRDKGRNLLCVRKIEDANRDSTFAELGRIISDCELDAFFKISLSPPQITCYNGNKIIFRGVFDTRQREKLKSIAFSTGKLTDVWIEEATELTQSDFEIIDDRLRGTLPKGLFYQMRLTFNPVSANHWLKKRFFDSPTRTAYTHSSTYLENPFIDSGFLERMEERKVFDPEGYRIYGLGEWGETEGLVLPNYTVLEEVPRTEDFEQLAMGQDFGFNHFNVLLLLGFRDGDIYILRESAHRGLTTEELIGRGTAEHFPKKCIMYCDSAEPDRILTWKKAGFMAVPVKKGSGSVHTQIDFLRGRKIFISPCCTHTISEISAWKWEMDTVSGQFLEVPVSRNDDAMAALRYGIEGLRGARLKGVSKKMLGI